MTLTELADAWQAALGDPERRVEPKPGHSPQEIWLCWFRGRRYASVIADEDGDTVLLFSDRASDSPAQAAEVSLRNAEMVREKLHRFLMGDAVDPHPVTE